ncbi:MAG: hypothetical protein IKP36_07180 [Bacteroidaceae bacterium]|nr:hypothetical protein [Bacteroidaceae bacterium]
MRQRLLFILSSLVLLAACESYDCTLYNAVNMYGAFYQDGKAVAINDTLTITACGTDAVLLNRSVGTAQLTLPLSYWQDEDTLVFSINSNGYFFQDTVWITKTNLVHYESPDCPAKLFHTIQDVRSTHDFIESISITRPSVNYETTENLQIHLYSASD